MIKRILQIEIERGMQQFPAVVITGPRQGGKTTLARIIQKEQSSLRAIYLDLELPSDRQLLRSPELFLRQQAQRTVILDEVQRMPELFPLLRALIDQNRRPGRFVLLGSASPELLLKSGESLAGRAMYAELTPFQWVETGEAEIWRHWYRGGFPEAFLARSDEAARFWLQNFVRTYTERDLPQLGFPATADQAQTLLQAVASLHGNLLNYSTLSSGLGISAPTVTKYVDFLEHSFLVRRLRPFYHNLGKRLVKAPKLYFRDSGVLHLLWNLRDRNELFGLAAIGNSWEGYVMEQIIPALRPPAQAFFYRTSAGAEIDLVIADGMNPLASIEVKFADVPSLTKGTYLAINDLKTPHNFVVTPAAREHSLREDIVACDLSTVLGHLRGLGLLR